jgi:hypothetical protein
MRPECLPAKPIRLAILPGSRVQSIVCGIPRQSSDAGPCNAWGVFMANTPDASSCCDVVDMPLLPSKLVGKYCHIELGGEGGGGRITALA